MIIIIFGLPGAGKSYFASSLAKKIGAHYINSDKVRKELVKIPKYSNEEQKLVYKQLFNMTYDHVNSQNPVVIDASFYLKQLRDDFNVLAKDLNKTIKWVEIRADEDIIKQRVSNKRDYSDASYEIYQKLKSLFAPFTAPHLILKSTNDNLDDMLDQAIGHLEVPNQPVEPPSSK